MGRLTPILLVVAAGVGCSVPVDGRDVAPDAAGPPLPDAGDEPERPGREDAGAPDAEPPPAPFEPYTLRIEARIDGRSELRLHGTTARWHHYDHVAPGRAAGRDDPTVINGVAWQPVWPDVGGDANRDCDCDSSVFEGMTPAIPRRLIVAKPGDVSGRGKVFVDLPRPDNDFAMTIEFDDNDASGSTQMVLELDLSEP